MRNEADEQLIAKIREVGKGTFWEYLGCELVDANSAGITARLRVESHHLNHLGIVHGGVYASLLDSAMGMAAIIARPRAKVVTTNLNISYVAPFQEGELLVTAEVLHVTRNLVTAQGTIKNGAGDKFALAMGTFRAKDQPEIHGE